MNAKVIDPAVSVRKGLKRLQLTIEVLDSDVRFANEQWLKNPSSQFWRRTLVRCLCALFEGTLGLLKGATIEISQAFKVALSNGDIEIVTETRSYIEQDRRKTKPAFQPFPDNVKKTFKVFLKAHGNQPAFDFDDAGFGALCETALLRNKLMHPKGPFDVEVNDQAITTAERGMRWFDDALSKIFALCGEAVTRLDKH